MTGLHPDHGLPCGGQLGSVLDLLEPQLNYPLTLKLLITTNPTSATSLRQHFLFDELGNAYGKTLDTAYLKNNMRWMRLYRELLHDGQAEGGPWRANVLRAHREGEHARAEQAATVVTASVAAGLGFKNPSSRLLRDSSSSRPIAV